MRQGSIGRSSRLVKKFRSDQPPLVRELAGVVKRSHDLIDLLGPARYHRSGDELAGRGLYLDLPPWGFHLFRIQAAE